jgi:hypothetical protein
LYSVGFPLFLNFVTQENRGNLKIHQKLMLVLLYKKNYWNLKIKLIIQPIFGSEVLAKSRITGIAKNEKKHSLGKIGPHKTVIH